LYECIYVVVSKIWFSISWAVFGGTIVASIEVSLYFYQKSLHELAELNSNGKNTFQTCFCNNHVSHLEGIRNANAVFVGRPEEKT
jgi:hypothetical protein